MPTALLLDGAIPVAKSVRDGFEPISDVALVVCDGVAEACRRVRQHDIALVLAHLSNTGPEGVIRLLRAVACARRPCPVLVLDDAYHADRAAALLRAGAADYLALPDELPRLVRLAELLTRRLRLTAPAAPPPPEGPPALMEMVHRVAPQDTTLLLTGETGTGKTRLARLVHELSPRRSEPFLVVDCSALSTSLIESELFGHVKGAFTGADRDRPGKLAAAGRGTLLLDEVNSLPQPLQGKLLRAVDERVYEPVGSNSLRPVQARLIAASNVALDQEVQAGRFRQDLYYRLGVVGFHLPPLRQRRQEVAGLAARFLAEFAARNRPDVVELSAEAVRTLEEHDWPGNVRELRNVVERAVALCRGPAVLLEDLPDAVLTRVASVAREETPQLDVVPPRPVPTTLSASLAEAEMHLITEVLAKHRNNRLRAAAELGISRMALYKKLRKHGMIQPTNGRC
jgi:two-component system response regulator PilR (NtrC family)